MQHKLSLGKYEGAVATRLRRWHEERFGRRLWDKDSGLWPGAAPDDVTARLGWLDLPEKSRVDAGAWKTFADGLAAEGIEEVVLLGMGGSSLAPEVFASTFGKAQGYPRLVVLDSTHPDAVRSVETSLSLNQSLFIVSSKSGTTIETVSLFDYFFQRLGQVSAEPGRNFIAITDAGTPLDIAAQAKGFRIVINAPPDVGGRFSALSAFGLVPAAIAGASIRGLLEAAEAAAASCARDIREDQNPALALGAALGEMALAGRDKLTFFTSPSIAGLPNWIEQLVAESTGKNGKGLVPIVDEPWLQPDRYGSDRVFAYISLRGERIPDDESRLEALEKLGHPVLRTMLDAREELGAEMFIWEIATSAACGVLGVNPFDQPDVEISKRLARAAMEEPRIGEVDRDQAAPLGGDTEAMKNKIIDLLGRARPGSYVSLQAYLQPCSETTDLLKTLRLRLSQRTGLPTTLGYGPRFLHSTGQLHKGGPATGVFIQIVDTPPDGPRTPSAAYTFADLIGAQSLGDLAALRQRARPVVRLEIAGEVGPRLAGITALIAALEER